MARQQTASERITAEVTTWPGVQAGPGTRGEFAFRVGGHEIGHLHGDHAAHFGFPRDVGAELREQGRVGPHPVNRHSTKMAARRIETDADIRDVIELMRLNYDRVAASQGSDGAAQDLRGVDDPDTPPPSSPKRSTSAFSEDELSYLHGGRRLARLATVGADGTPHVVPVGWSYNAQLDAIEIGGRDFASTKKFRDVKRSGRAAVVIDDLASTDPWRPRGIEVRGRADAIEDPRPLIRIHPERIVSWGLAAPRVPGTDVA
jgi:pyridoxamine 5'-phosphate oxidase family protein